MIKRKRGVAHIEMVISFGIFALFTFWLIVYLNPIRNQNISNVLIDTIEMVIIENTSIEVIETPVKVVSPAACFKINNSIDTTVRDNIFVTDSNGNTLKFDIPDPQNISIETSASGDFYKIHYAGAQFITNSLEGQPCPGLNASQYNYTSTRISYPLLITRLETVKNLYESNYEKLKEDFNFPPTSDFSVNITNLLTKLNLFQMTKQKPRRVEVIAKEIPVEIMQTDGTTIKAIMNLQVW